MLHTKVFLLFYHSRHWWWSRRHFTSTFPESFPSPLLFVSVSIKSSSSIFAAQTGSGISWSWRSLSCCELKNETRTEDVMKLVKDLRASSLLSAPRSAVLWIHSAFRIIFAQLFRAAADSPSATLNAFWPAWQAQTVTHSREHEESRKASLDWNRNSSRPPTRCPAESVWNGVHKSVLFKKL